MLSLLILEFCFTFSTNGKLTELGKKAFSTFYVLLKLSLRGKCLNTEFFLVRIYLYSVRLKKNTDQKKFGIWTLSRSL